MSEGWRGWLLRLLKVPPEPALPEGGAIRVFRAAPAYLRYKVVLWALGQIGAAVGLIGGLVGISFLVPMTDSSLLLVLLYAAEAFAWGFFVVQLGFSLAVLRLDFDLRWYILSDRSLRIREGIMTVREKTMTFANLQQISIRQNPIQRLLGIADVHVRTAGGGSGGGKKGHEVGESMHEAYFRGVANAGEIRRAIQERVRLHRDTGLGNPDEPEPRIAGGREDTGGALLAARELLQEMRGLREALGRP